MSLIGFRRNIYLDWLEETAALVCLGQDAAAIREKMDARVSASIKSDVNRRQALDALCNIWGHSDLARCPIHDRAKALFQSVTTSDGHVALHYGLTLLAYPFFRQACEVIGQAVRFGEPVRTATLQERMPAKIGSMGALHDACKRVTFSLRDWGILVDGERRYEYVLRTPALQVSDPGIGCWLLAAALQAHPAETMPFDDLLRLPELFPFSLGLSSQDARQCDLLDVHRAGGGWEMVSLAVSGIRDGENGQ